MKKTILIAGLLISGFVFQTASAQVKLDVSVNIDTQPEWGPVGYDHVEYYYLPDIDVYYYVPKQQYIYLNRGHWKFRASLPDRYSNYDIYTGYKVVINEPTPYHNADVYRSQYEGYKGRHDQEIIRDSNDSKYFTNKHNPKHRIWRQSYHRHNNGRKKQIEVNDRQ